MRCAILGVGCVWLAGGALRAQEAIPEAPSVVPSPPWENVQPDEVVPEAPDLADTVICVTPRGYCVFSVPQSPGPGAPCHCGSEPGVVD